MPLTPKVKMQISVDQLSTLLNVPIESVEILHAWVTPDPLSLTVILASDSEFEDIYLPYGGFIPGISYETIPVDFFPEPAP